MSDLLATLAALDAELTEGCAPGPWHAVHGAARWWLDNAAGDSSYPDAEDVALLVTALPKLLAALRAAEEVKKRMDLPAYEYTPMNFDDPEIIALRAALAALNEGSTE